MTGPLCDFCGAQRALVFCASDAACLCLPCDLHVHSANPLSRRHLRAPLCGRCRRRRNSSAPPQPAAVRCPDCGLSCCVACELGCPGPGEGHRSARPVVPYSGCPSPAELSAVLDYSGTETGSTMMTPINKRCESTCWDEDPPVAGVNGGEEQQQQQQQQQQQGVLLYKESNLNMLGNPPCKDVGLGDGDELCEGFNSDEDGFNMENIDEILEWWKDGGLNGLFMENNNLSVADSNSNGRHIDNTLEASSSIQTDWASLPSVGGSLHAVDSNADQFVINLNAGTMSFPSANVSKSNLTGESSVADYQDCRVPPMFLGGGGDSLWDSNLEISSTPQARKEAKMRYNQKKKSRLIPLDRSTAHSQFRKTFRGMNLLKFLSPVFISLNLLWVYKIFRFIFLLNDITMSILRFGKQIRYASRKARADTRRRVRGRFVKAGEPYDYDPLEAKK